VQIAATFPASGPPGQPIQATGAGITVTLPHAVAAGLGRLNAATVRLTADLGTAVTENGTSAIAPWPGLASPIAPLPAKGSPVLTATGAVPSVTIKAAGNATFSAAGLSLLLTSFKASGYATRPPSMLAQCTLNAGQNATLAVVPVTGSSSPAQHGGITVGSQYGGSHARAHAGAITKTCPPLPKNGLKLNPRFPPPKPPHGVRTFHGPQVACAYIVGFSDVRKLNEASLIGPGLSKLDLTVTVYAQFNKKLNYLQTQNVGQLDYQGRHEFPPARATLLAFGFMPVSATLQLSEIGTVNAISVGPEVPSSCKHNCQQIVTVSSRVTLRIYNVTVNGVSLNVGPSCQSATPFDIILKGIFPEYTVPGGGTLGGSVTIPPFTGCRDGTENLDPIFTASVSGPGNDVLLTQGAPCFVNGGFGCPPCKPIPARTLKSGPPKCQPATGGSQRAGRQHGG
jgi:hypothetical protein